MTKLTLTVALLVAALGVSPVAAQNELPALHVEQTADGFEVYIAAALSKKKVPVRIVTDPEQADYILKAAQVEVEQVSTGKRVVNCLFAYCGGNEDKASTSVTLLKDGEIKWSYAVNKGRGAKNRQSMAEAIAKHLKDEYFRDRK